jgi:hypothetical protein
MFTGTTPKEVMVLIKDIMKDAKYRDVFVGCSGNFTTDRLLSNMGFNVYSNDVSLYSKVIGDVLMGKQTEMSCTNRELQNVFDFWEDSRFKNLIEVMFAMRVAGFHERANDYQEEMFNAFIEQSNKYYSNTVEKLNKGAFDFKIADFFYGDFFDHLKSGHGKGVGISFPPTYKGGYEKMNKYVDESFEYEHAKYNLYDPKNGGTMFGELLDNGENLLYSDRYFEELDKWLVAKVNLGAQKNSIYAYSSIRTGNNYYMERKPTEIGSKIKIVPVDYEFTEQSVITAESCKVNEVNYFKAFYMANKVNYTTGGDFAIAFKVDGMAFGFCSFSKQLSTLEEIFMQSDFVVNSHTAKLSKLLIMLVKSHDVRVAISRKLYNYYEKIKTTVYTKSPISMKYRGVFKLERRDEGKLIYASEFSNESILDIYKKWLKKYKA